MQKQLLVLFLIGLVNSELPADEPSTHCTGPAWFACHDKLQCIASHFVCDGDPDCRDSSDELNCKTKPFVPVECKSNEWRCKDNVLCIDVEEYCNGQQDCLDGSDEPDNCTAKSICNGFKCKNGKCINIHWACDGNNDCGDSSDEENCDKVPMPPRECNNTIGKYLCNNKDCILLSLACDGHDDCGDGSDEYPPECVKAKTACNEKMHCQNTCSPTPRGAQCSCPQGYLLENDTCIDINECKTFHGCSQICRNIEGSYYCECDFGYKLQSDGKGCKAETGEALLIYASKSSIRGYYLESEVYFPIAEDLHHVVGVSLDAYYVYWTDIQVGDEAIFRSLDDGTKREVIVTAGLGCPEDLAIDWISGNIYFTDSMYKHVGVCNKKGDYCTVVIKEDTEKPRGIALLPKEGKMYWSDWGAKPHISMAYMDGSNRTFFIKDNIGWPNGLTIDYPSKRLYWVDAKLKVIESILLDGTDRRTVLHDVAKHPYSISIFEDELYWSDWSTNAIHSCNKFTGKNYTTLFHKNESVYGIHIYHPTLKATIGHPCLRKPCSQLCLLSANRTYTCACTMDKELSDDKHTCKDSQKRKHLAIAAGSTIIDYYHEILGRPRTNSKVTADRITAMTYDSLEDLIIAADETSKSIFQFNTRTGEFNHKIPIVNELVECIAFDYFGNNVYKSDTAHKKIDVHSLTTGEKTEFSFTSSPYDLIVVPEEGIMFIVFRTKNDYHIDKAQMNGLGSRSHLIEYNLLGPRVSLAYDLEAHRLYWADEGTGRIESVDNQGQNRLLFRTGLNGPVSLAVMDNHIFWTTRKSNRLSWGDKSQLGISVYGNKGIHLEHASKTSINLLQTISGTYNGPMVHPCFKSNGGCSHICLVTNATQRLCACPSDFIIHPDQKTCRPKTSCLADEFKCSNEKCITSVQRCNGVKDCPDGEDEKDCRIGESSCHTYEFACHSGECIAQNKHCDSVFDCSDHSDEQDCDDHACKEFRCRDGTCIPKVSECNGTPDCEDLSDEENCSARECDEKVFFKCASGTCIPRNWECDGVSDCDDSSDEHSSCIPSECGKSQFTCKDGGCIDELFVCNGHDECQDGSDEQDCAPKDKIDALICPKEYFKCLNSSICIRLHLRCNSEEDCPLGDDEKDCSSPCSWNEYKCNNGKCIPMDWHCDHTDDCGDNSDEVSCDTKKPDRPAGSPRGNCSEGEFSCTTGKMCLPLRQVCDGDNDCFDGSDEDGQCGTACLTNPCENICHKTPLGPVCSCRPGYHLDLDGKSCVDIDECQTDVCSQNCTNTVGSYFCSCFEGFALKLDRVSCKSYGSSMKIYMSGDRGISVAMSSLLEHGQKSFRHRNLYEIPPEAITGFDVDVRKEAIYWSTGFTGYISKFDLTTYNITPTATPVGRPEVLAVDWITDNIYFFDSMKLPKIRVCHFTSSNCATIHYLENIQDKITSITVDPKQEILLWSQVKWNLYGKSEGTIKRSDLTGENVLSIVQENLGLVSGLTIDPHRSILYWADHSNSNIESSDFFGNDRKFIGKKLFDSPIGLNFFEDSLYWKSDKNSYIKKLSLYGTRTTTMIPSNINNFFVISQISRQPPGKNVCENSTCEHLCVPQKNRPVCLCEHDMSRSDYDSKCSTLNFSEELSKVNSGPVVSVVRSEQQSALATNDGSGATFLFAGVVLVALIGTGFYIKNYRPELVDQITHNYWSDIHFPKIPFLRRNNANDDIHEYSNPIIHQDDFNRVRRMSIDNDATDIEASDNVRLINR